MTNPTTNLQPEDQEALRAARTAEEEVAETLGRDPSDVLIRRVRPPEPMVRLSEASPEMLEMMARQQREKEAEEDRQRKLHERAKAEQDRRHDALKLTLTKALDAAYETPTKNLAAIAAIRGRVEQALDQYRADATVLGVATWTMDAVIAGHPIMREMVWMWAYRER